MSAEMPKGWKLVPIVMTPEMRNAAKGALKKFITTIPLEERQRCKKQHGGTKVGVNLKHELRYRAAIDAAPSPPSQDSEAGK